MFGVFFFMLSFKINPIFQQKGIVLCIMYVENSMQVPVRYKLIKLISVTGWYLITNRCHIGSEVYQ